MNADASRDGIHSGGQRVVGAELTRRIIGAFFDVYNDLGIGFLESVYRRAMALTLRDAGLVAEEEASIEVAYRGRALGFFRADLVVEGSVIRELKAARRLEDLHERHLLNYLRATDLDVGLLLNFGPRPSFRRLAFRNDHKRRGSIRVDLR